MKWLAPLALSLAAGLSACASKPNTPQVAAPPPAASAPEESRPGEGVAGAAASLSALQAEFVEEAGDRVFFDVDSYVLRPDAQSALERQAAWLRRHPEVMVLIEGHCDERGTREYNLALGARRSNAVLTLLVQRGVAASRVRAISYGKERPFDPGSGEAAWARNRNGHTVLIDLATR